VKLSIIMPVFNEEKTLRAGIAAVLSLPTEKELVIVDDGSTDSTPQILSHYATDKNVQIIYHTKNIGKAGAIKSAIPVTTGDIIAIQDADLEFDPRDLLKLAEPIRNGQAAVVYGSRYLMKEREQNIYPSFRMGVRVLSIAANLIYNQQITDEATCYKVFRADILKKIPLVYNRFEFCPEVTARVSKMGYKIMELPINYYPRSFAEGKKIRWQDGVKALWVLLKLRFADGI
jgi:dolichol-phosphate mannosyltransferase